MRRSIVMLTGYDRCGKDYIANKMENILQKEGYTVKIIHFADALKTIVRSVLNIDEQIFNKAMEEKDKSTLKFTLDYEYNGDEFSKSKLNNLRTVLINTGRTLRREFGKDFFVNIIVNQIEEDNDAEVFIIPDLRFRIELRSIKKFIKRKIRSSKSNYKRKNKFNYYDLRTIFVESDLPTCGNNKKRYEIDELGKFDFTIENVQNEDILKANVEKLLKSLNLKK